MNRDEARRRVTAILDDEFSDTGFPVSAVDRLVELIDEVTELRDDEVSLARVLRDRILGLPDHPWVPGGMFKDGEIMRALARFELTE